MGHCRDIDSLVTPYLDGEASASERAAVDALCLLVDSGFGEETWNA